MLRFDSVHRYFARVSALGCAVLAITLAPSSSQAQQVDYQRQIRPLLSNNCFACHGADAEHREAGLRLDHRDSALKGGDSGEAAIVPEQPGESELIARVMSDDPDARMPPPDSKKELTAAEKELLKRWIAQGADYQPHWAFTAPMRPAVPKVKDADWPRGEIDRFVMARLQREKLKPSPEADRSTLVRRLYLDILGLPPSPSEVDEFVSDESPEAYEHLVDRLLASPHYGERWGRVWLDGARYADSDGYEKDKPRFVWAYRDWVINSLNRDLPYNQFVIEQIAGDLLPRAGQDQIVATGLLRNSMINEEGGVDPEQFRMEAMFDRMDCIGKNVLALTVQCAQCHSHKYDPLTHEEYYRMFAFLNDTNEANVAVYTSDEQQQQAKILRQIRQLETRLKRDTPDWAERMTEWEQSVRGDQPRWVIVRPELDSSGGQKHTLLEDGSILAQGYAPTKHQTDFEVTTSLQRITAVRLELLNDPNLPLNGPGRSIYGTCALSEFKLQVGPADGSSKMKLVKIASATADVNPPERELDKVFDDRDTKKTRTVGPIELAIDGKEETAWTSDLGPGRSNVPRKAVFVLAEPIETSGELTKLNFHLVQKHGGWNSDDNQNQNLGRFRISVTTGENVAADPLPAPVRALVSRPKAQRTAAQQAAMFSHWRTMVDGWADTNAKIESLWAKHPRGTSQLVLGARKQSRQSFVLARGDFLKPTEPVDPGTPAFLNPLDVEEPTRLDFARWLVSRDSPTAARAVVNRVWQAYFGTGLVATSEDFGLQGEPPTHPELLDWLAVEFMDRGWSLKQLHKMIVTSAAYRQQSKVSPKLLERDPQNRLLARGSRFRVEAETVRDVALAVSGLLNPAVGGPSVCPPAPEFLFKPPDSYGPKTWNVAEGSDRYRRALYTFRFRSVPYPALQAFDAPTGEFACVRRVRSNTPLQALVTLNEPVFLDCARALARRTLAEGGSNDDERLRYAFITCTARAPDAEEASLLSALLARQQQRFEDGELKPWDLAAEDPELPPMLPKGVTPATLAAWTAVSRVLLNLDETISRQ